MSGRFIQSECPKCKGTGQIHISTLWEDGPVPCPNCDGGGVLYEYSPNEVLCPECQTSYSEPVCPVCSPLHISEYICSVCGRTYGCPYERDCCPCDL